MTQVGRLIAFLTVPMYSLWISLRFYAPWNRKELVRTSLTNVYGKLMTHISP